VPTRFVGIHLSLALIASLFGLSFIADPCGGGGDLCLGGAIGLAALGLAGVGGIGIVTWLVGRRASPLLVWDAVLLSFATLVLLSSVQGLVQLGALATALLAVAGAVLAGRHVMGHRIERILTVVALVLAVLVIGEGGLDVLVIGLAALLVGSRRPRTDIGQVA
jgi:hypothetical protein